MDWFTLRLLADEWAADLASARVADAWTQAPRELSLLVEPPDGEAWTLRVICDPALTVAFRTPGGGRQKRNTTSVFPGLAGRTVRLVRAADRDRLLILHLHGGEQLVAPLFGPRSTVLWANADGLVRDAFLRADEWTGKPAPDGRAAADPMTPDVIAGRWIPAASLAQTVRRAAPLLPALLVADAVRAAGLDPAAAAPATCPGGLAEAVAALRARLDAPEPHVAWRGKIAEALLPVPLLHPPAGWTQETFATADAATRVWAKKALGQARFAARFRPVETALAAAAGRRARSAEAMLAELAQPSRADRYEAWAHLLMAAAGGQAAGAETVTLPDLLGGTDTPVEVPLDPARTAVENAERYYRRARTARRARVSAEARWEGVHTEAERAAALLARLRAVDRLTDLEAFLVQEANALTALVRPEAASEPAESFRRVALPDGWTALVGRNARQNAALTTHVARPHDLWLHARGVPGSHVVVPRASKTLAVPEHVVRAAAALAAKYSEAKTQALVPVTVTERKYVRPVKGGAPGLVRVERERVVDVAPGQGIGATHVSAVVAVVSHGTSWTTGNREVGGASGAGTAGGCTGAGGSSAAAGGGAVAGRATPPAAAVGAALWTSGGAGAASARAAMASRSNCVRCTATVVCTMATTATRTVR